LARRNAHERVTEGRPLSRERQPRWSPLAVSRPEVSERYPRNVCRQTFRCVRVIRAHRPRTRARPLEPSRVRRSCHCRRRTCPSMKRTPQTCRPLATPRCLRAAACQSRDSDRRKEWSRRAIWVRIARAVSARHRFPLLRPRAVGTRRQRLHRRRVELVPAVGAAVRACRDV
jgi:hypothetical protein